MRGLAALISTLSLLSLAGCDGGFQALSSVANLDSSFKGCKAPRCQPTPTPNPMPTPTPTPLPTATPSPGTPSTSVPAGWSTLKVGAGGYLSGIDASNDGTTKVVRTDTFGAYLWDEVAQRWSQLVLANTMPAPFQNQNMNGPVYEIRVAPSSAQRIYMVTRGSVFRSDNRGLNWIKLSFTNSAMQGDDGYRTWGQKMIVDPVDPSTVYLGTPTDGVYRTTDAGVTWSKVSTIPNAQLGGGAYAAGFSGMAFDPSSGVLNGKTKTIYIPGFGNGVMRSTDAGATWATLSGGPVTVQHAKVALDGTYFAASADGHLWRYRAGAWQDVTPQNMYAITVAVHPQDAMIVVAQSDSGVIRVSRDGGSTWASPQTPLRIALDIPWLAWTNESYMSSSDILFDPAKPNRLWFSQGIGVWIYDIEAMPGTTATWVSRSAGIEQLCTNIIIAPPGGKPLVGSWDRPVFRIEDPTTYPLAHGPDRNDSIQMGWSLDWASSNPQFVVGLFNWAHEDSGYSADGGVTWQKFASYPPVFGNGKLGGSIAASTPSNIVWIANNNGTGFYTLDGGASWSAATFPNAPTGAESGFGWAYYFKRQILAADRVLPNTFYAYNYVSGVYRSTDGGRTWAQIKNQPLGLWTSYHAKLKSVPGQAGHLFFSAGTQGSGTDPHPGDIPFKRSTDGGVTWTDIPNVFEVLAFGFGRAVAGSSYPAIYMAGYLNGVYGIYRSIDNASSWQKLGETYPMGWLDQVVTIEGDMDTYGRVYVGFGGSGSAVGQFN